VSQSAAQAALSEPILQSYAPITGGETKDSDDAAFLDVNLSVKIRLAPAALLPRIRPFFAMSSRFGFYWGTRPGSPVIGKSYNPELFFRILPNDEVIQGPNGNHFEYAQFVDVGYAHESNGQLVHTLQQYQRQLVSSPGIDYANNFIHRGWDYLDVAWKRTHRNLDLTYYLEGKYFLPDGLLQGRQDEYHSWEDNREGKRRKAVDGVELSVDWPSHYAHFITDETKALSRPNLTVKYLTGYQSPLRYSTFRAEFGFQLWSMPLALWGQVGYLSNLAIYYKKVKSVGLEIRFVSF